MSLIERARHLTRPRSAAATNRKVANHVGPPENGILYADSAQLALYAAKDGSFVLDKLSSSDGSQANSARRIWERIPETYEHFKGPRSGWIGNNSSDPRDGWTKRPSSAYETDPEVVEAPAADRIHTQRDVDVKIGPTLCSEFTVAVADFTLSVNEMKAIVDSELNKGVSAVRGAVTQAMAEISDSVGKIKTPNDVLPEIQAELLRLHRETQIGFESRVLKEIRQANADSRAEIQQMKSLLEQSLDATATLTSQNNHYDVSATEINLKATTNIQNTVGIISDKPSPVLGRCQETASAQASIMDLDPLIAQITKLITDMKEAIVLQGYRNCMPLTNQVTALQESIAAQNERASADTTRLLQAIAKIDRYNVDLNPVLDTLNQGLAKLERTRAPPESAPPESSYWALKFATFEKAMTSIQVDRSVDLTPVLEAIAKLKKESNHGPVLAAIAQLHHSSSLQVSLDAIRSYVDFTPIVEKVDRLERRLDKIHASPELVLSRIEELQHYLVPMIDTISKTWKSDLVSFKKSVNVSLSKGVDVSPVVVGLKELMEKSETMSSSLNVGMMRIHKQMTGLEEANQARSNGEVLSPEMRAIAKLEATVEQMHEMQEAILGTLEKQEMAHQNRILPVAELSLWQPAAADYTVSTNMQQTTACVRNSTYRDALR